MLSDRIILASERRKLVPYSDMHIWRLEKAGQFPRRIKLGAHRVGWSLQEVTEWIDARKAERDIAASDFENSTAPIPSDISKRV